MPLSDRSFHVHRAIWVILLMFLATPILVHADNPATPNFILVVCDNLGYGDIEPFGSRLHRTPHLNRMAREGRVFTHFYVTAGVCTPSRSSIMTGCYPQRVGMHTNERDGIVLRPLSPYGLNPDELTLAEVLKNRGYATTIIGKWHLGDQPEFLPTRQGFDSFFGIPYSDDMTQSVGARIGKRLDGHLWPPLPLMENERVIEAPCDRTQLTRRYTERAIEWITEHQDQPFFLYLPHAMPGSTRSPFASESFRGKSSNGPWGDAVEELDWSMGSILAHLRTLDLAERTLVIWTSDNGAPMTSDPDDLTRGSNRPLFGRGYSTSEGAFRVPAIAWQPGTVPPDTQCSELVSTLDLLPTFASLTGQALDNDHHVDGYDISTLLFGTPDARSPYPVFYYYHQDQLQAVRSGPWKLFLPVATEYPHPHFSENRSVQTLLFNVVNDPSSRKNVAVEHPEQVAQLTKRANLARRELGDLNQTGEGQRPAGRIERTAQAQVLQETALDVIEGVRGGRHWVNQKTDPPRTPKESLASFEIEPGLDIQLIASEPLVRDPVAITFDKNGDMYVVEYGDYPEGPEPGERPLSRVVLLKDDNGDGTLDRRYVYADNLNFTHSLMAFDKGLLVGAKTEIIYLRDTDGDHVADIRKVLFKGFQAAHPQMQIGNPRWGMDNWIYLNYGPGQIQSTTDPEKVTEMPRKDFRFHPDRMTFEADSGMGQFGNTIDRWGHRFYCTNRNPIMTTLLPPSELQRNPYAVITGTSYDVGNAGGATQVYPQIAMKSNYLSHAGTHTSACGVTAYNGDLLGKPYLNSVFVCEPIGHLVTRSIVEVEGLRLRAHRARPKVDFLTSNDTWFRPASLSNGPDGALYLADMYRLWVEHPKFLPPEIAKQLDWRAGEDRGRIYRIAPQNQHPRPFHPPTDLKQTVALLEDPNGWRQFLGHRLLVENPNPESASLLRPLLQHSAQPTARLHALWTLEGIAALTINDLSAALADINPHVRASAVRLSRSPLYLDSLFSQLLPLVDDPDTRVRFQVALALGDHPNSLASSGLADLALRDGQDTWFAGALLSSARSSSGAILAALVTNEAFARNAGTNSIRLIKQLATIVGTRGNPLELESLLSTLNAPSEASSSSQVTWWKSAIITGLGMGLPRHQGPLSPIQLPSLLSNPPDDLAQAVTGLRNLMRRNMATAMDPSASLTDRIAAIELMAYQPFAQTKQIFFELLSHAQPAAVQSVSIDSLATGGHPESSTLILRNWAELGPSVRGPALNLLLRRTDSTRQVLEAMASGTMRAAILSIDQRVRLLKHPDEDIRNQAITLFGGAVSTNRQQVALEFQKSLNLSASVASGAKVFQRICAACHVLDGKGHPVGPDLSDVRNRSRLALLYDILDPNAKVEPRFTAYQILTLNGTILNGLIMSETPDAVVLRMAENKLQTINRNTIDSMHASELSLMPEGVEKDITLQEMADLLEFLKSRE